ncbi:hypothetical protein [Treponema pedis]|uniref:hypothetical protein n=1 Tax=Treponema pedis TaxID=409322 RepID=UPI00040B6135|nr:hypothetical protein [Treponema pedis]
MRYYYDAALRKTVLWKSRPLLKAFNEGAHPRDAAGRFTDKGFFYTEEQRAQAVKNDLKKTMYRTGGTFTGYSVYP